MARVTKINVGGTNYDIAHEGELKNSGFEVVTALPTTGLFAGREVIYNGKKYVYSSGWKEQITSNTMREANLLWGGRNISDSYSPIDGAMMSELSANVMAFPNPAGISIEYSRDGGITWLDYDATDKQKVEMFTTTTSLACGNADADGLLATVGFQLRITITPNDCNLFTALNKIIMTIATNGADNCWFTFKGLKNKDVVAGNEDDTYYDTIVNKAVVTGWTGYNVVNFDGIKTSNNLNNPTHVNLFYRLRLIFGYDTVISTSHSGLKVRELRFFGNGRYTLPSNLARYNHLYSYDWQQNALFPAKVESKELINFDVNNIEPTQTGSVSKTSTWLWQYLTQAINWLKANNVRLSAYNTKIAALEQADSDNNASTQSVMTDLSATIEELSNGLAAVARSGSYNDLTDKPTFSGSYNDLTDKPTLAAVATSGSYNDLTDKPTFSGSYNDLTDKPTLFSGSYDDLTDKPTLAAVATSGSYNDLTDNPTQLPNPNPIIIKTADGVSVRYDGSTSGGVTLEAGNNAELTATQDSDDTMTVKFGAIVPQTLPNPNALNIMVLDSEGALLGPSIVYDGVATKYIELIEGYGIKLSNSNLSTGQAITINLKQIAGTTLLGNANDTIGIPQAVTMTQLRTMLGSLTLNDIDVTLGGNNSYTLPCYIDYNGVDYPARIREHWLQIYRNGEWANLVYLGDILPTQVGQITSLDNLDWYNEQVSEYEVDSNTTTSILNGTTLPATVLMNCLAEQLSLNFYPISGKQYGKGSLDNLITNLKDKGFSVFVENDLDAILSSGSDYLVRLKISKVPTTKAIIECYVAR